MSDGNEQLREPCGKLYSPPVGARQRCTRPAGHEGPHMAARIGPALALSRGEDAGLVKRLRLAAEIQDDANRGHAADLYREAADALAALSVSGEGDETLPCCSRCGSVLQDVERHVSGICPTHGFCANPDRRPVGGGDENERLRAALRAIAANAESFHKGEDGKAKSLAVIARWARDPSAVPAALAEGEPAEATA